MQNINLNKIIKLYFLFFLILSKMNVCFAADSIELVHSITEEELLEQNSQESLLNRELIYGTILFDPPKERLSSEFLPIKFENINPKESFEERLKIMNFTEQEEE